MAQRTQSQPSHPSTWLFGETGSIQVWTAEGDARVTVAVLIDDVSVVLLNHRIVGTPAEYDAMAWALGQIARGRRGFVVHVD